MARESKKRRILASGLVLLGIALVPAAALYSPGNDGEFSTYLDPAFEGAPPSFPVDGVQNYGETDVDAHHLIDWDLVVPTPPDPEDCDLPSAVEQFFHAWLPDDHGLWLGSMLLKVDGGGGIVENPFQTPADWAAALRVPWHLSSSLFHDEKSRQDLEYRVRYIPLPSGAQVLVFSPGTGTLDDFTLGANSPCPDFDQDVLYWVPGTHGDPYYQNPMPWLEVDDVNTVPLLGGELGRTVGWFRDGSIGHEAMRRGMTVVVPEWNVAKRPLLWSLIQLIEIDRHLNSAEYVGNPYTTSPTGAPLRHRNFIMGGSFGGYVANAAALHLDWLFHGAIARDSNLDLRQTYAFQEAYDFLRGRLSGNYSVDELTLTRDPYMQMIIGDLEKGYGGPPGAGLVGVPVDLAGLSLLSTDLIDGLDNLAHRLTIPFVLITGDEDYGMYTFYDQELGAINPEVLEIKNPTRGHPDVGLFEVWNQSNQVLGQLMSMPDIVSCAPLDPSPPQIDWSVQTQPSEPHLSEAFYDVILKPDRSPAADHGSGLVVERVTSGAWPDREVWEGLGASGEIVVQDVTGDGIPEVYASTARGDLVGIRLMTDLGTVTGLEEIFRAPIGDFFGHAEIELDPENASLLVLPRFGPLSEVHLDPMTGTATVLSLALPAVDMGRGLHSLRRKGPGVYTLLNDQGEVVEVTRGASVWTVTSRDRVEGAMIFLEPDADGLSGATYGSGHGFLKRYDFGQPGHPTDPADVGTYLGGYMTGLTPLANTGPGGATHVGIVRGPTWRIALFDGALQEVGSILSCSGSPPRELEVLHVDSERVDLLTSWDVLPAAVGISKPGILALLPSAFTGTSYRDAEAVRHPQTGRPTLRDRLIDWLELVGRNAVPTDASNGDQGPSEGTTSTGDLVDGPVIVPGLTDPNDFASCVINDPQTRAVALDSPIAAIEPLEAAVPMVAVATNTGALFVPEWLATLHSGQLALIGDATRVPIPVQVLGDPWGAAFGLVRTSNTDALVVGPQDRAWILDVETGGILQELRNSTGNELEERYWGDRAHLGAAYVGGCAFGMYDGADLLEVGVHTVSPLLAFACREPHPYDWQQDWGGVKVVEVEIAPCIWEYDDPNPVFRSERLFAPSSTARPTKRSGAEVGNAVRWADLDANGTADLVVAAHSGVVSWFENSSSTGFSASPTPTGGTRDLGSRIMSLEVADLDGDSLPEIIVGTEMDYDPGLGTNQLSESGALYVFGLQAGALVELQRLPLGFGVYGIHHLPVPFTTANDYLVVGMANGRFRLVEVTLAPLSLVERYESTFWAPDLGAFNAIAHFPQSGGAVRLVMGSSGGLLAFDVRMGPIPQVTDG